MWFYSLPSGFFVHFGMIQHGYLEIDHKSALDFLDCSGPIRAHFLSTNLIVIKTAFENNLD